MNEKNLSRNKKFSFFKLFFTKYTIWGVLIILVAVILDLCNTKKIFWLDIIKNLFSTFGCALLVGAVFDFSQNSEASLIRKPVYIITVTIV